MTNLLIALKNIINNPITRLVAHYQNWNRANNMWDALECYIKDAFCNSFSETNTQTRDAVYSDFFSYLWNTSNPPDIIIKNGDSIEVKKIESLSASLALNSSYPKDKLHSDDSRITVACRTCEEQAREEKDIIYSIWVAPETNTLKVLWFIYGDCYAADREVYKRIADTISDWIWEIPDVDFTITNELAKIKKVDPLGITDLRVRGMWHIENPIKVFRDFSVVNLGDNFTMHAIMLETKYLSFTTADREALEQLQNDRFHITDIEIKSPNNPAQLLRAKFISYTN